VKGPRLLTRAWIERLCFPAIPGRFSGKLHIRLPDQCLQVV